MKSQSRDVRIIGIGHELPGEPISTADTLRFANIKCFDEAWVKRKLGIETRHSVRDLPGDPERPKLKEGMSNSLICAAAARKAMKMAEIDVTEIEMIIVATCTPDYPVPATSTFVQDHLGLPEVATMDVRSACCGGFQAVTTARQYLMAGTYKTILVCASDVGTMYGDQDLGVDGPHKKEQSVNWLLIGDAAAAVVLRSFEPHEDPFGIEILGTKINSIGLGKSPGFYMPAGGSINPITKYTIENGDHFFAHNFREVLANGQELYFRGIQDAINDHSLAISDVEVFIPHQANGKIAEFAAEFGRMFRFPEFADHIYNNFSRVGNTANASCLLSLSELVQAGRFREDDLVVLLGAESTKWLYGNMVLRYHPPSSKSSDRSGQVSRPRVKAGGSFTNRICTGWLVWAVGKYFDAKKAWNALW